jgi:hypothetical protein
MEDSQKFANVLPTLDATFIYLILKEEKSEDPSKFRPISLCNVVYIIITKVIANRIKMLLPSMNYLKKTCYIEGFQILDDIILVLKWSTLSNPQNFTVWSLNLAYV